MGLIREELNTKAIRKTFSFICSKDVKNVIKIEIVDLDDTNIKDKTKFHIMVEATRIMYEIYITISRIDGCVDEFLYKERKEALF